MQTEFGFVSYAHFTDKGSTPFAMAASMFFAMLLRSFKLYTIAPIIAVQDTIVSATITVIKSRFARLYDSFVSVNLISVSFVEDVSANLLFLFQLPTRIYIVSVIKCRTICYVLYPMNV